MTLRTAFHFCTKVILDDNETLHLKRSEQLWESSLTDKEPVFGAVRLRTIPYCSGFKGQQICLRKRRDIFIKIWPDKCRASKTHRAHTSRYCAQVSSARLEMCEKRKEFRVWGLRVMKGGNRRENSEEYCITWQKENGRKCHSLNHRKGGILSSMVFG